MKKSIFTYALLLIGAISICTICSCTEDYPIYTGNKNSGINNNNSNEKNDTEKPVNKTDTISIVNYTLNYQNLVTKDTASLVVNLSHPVTYYVVKETSGHYYINGVRLSEDMKQLIIPMPFFAYNKSYHFKLSLGNTSSPIIWEHDIKVNSFTDHFTYEGVAKSAITDYDRETIWMATTFPDRLYRISMSDPEHPTYRDFQNCPNVMTINPYNGKLYVGFTISNYDELSRYNNMIYVCNPETLEKEDSLQISWNNDSGYIDASPRSIAFTNDGWGLAVRSCYNSSGTDLCYIDSKDHHKTHVDDCWEEFYGSVTTSYDKKSIILQHLPYYNHDLKFVNRNNNAVIKSFTVHNKFHSDEYWAGGVRTTSRFHRSQPLYLVQCVQSLCVIDYSRDSYSPVYIQEGRDPHDDYDYNNDNHIIKFDCHGGYILYIDITKPDELFVGSIYCKNMVEIFHNPQRDQVLSVHRSPDGSTNTNLTIFNMSLFRR